MYSTSHILRYGSTGNYFQIEGFLLNGTKLLLRFFASVLNYKMDYK